MRILTIAFLVLLFTLTAEAQYYGTAFSFLANPRSATSYGLANQGAALSGGLSGIQYNPAALYSLSNPTAEYGKLDQFIWGPVYPLSWYRAGMNVEGIGVFGLEFTYFDLGEFARATTDPIVLDTFHGYEWALALSYATELNQDIALGGTVRNAHSHLAPFGTAQESRDGTANALLFSAGLLYHAAEWDDRFTLGFSLTDFGSPVHYVDPQQGDPAPAVMRLGISVAPIATQAQRLTLAFEGSRQIVDVNDNYSAKSSFAALFSSFKRWPHDIVGRAAAMYDFPNLSLTREIGLSEKIVVGVYDEPYDYGFNYLTASFELGISFYDFQLSFGAASVWNHIQPNYSPLLGWGRTIPEEALELTLSYRAFGPERMETDDGEKTTVVGGVGMSNPVGRYKNQVAGNGPAFSVECAKYTSDETAIVISIGYQANDVAGILANYDPDGSWRTWRASMAYRFGLTALPVPAYIQAGPVISRISYSGGPGVTMRPSYQYNGGFVVGGGIPFDLGPVIIVPSVDFVSMLIGQYAGPAPRLSGYSQWIFGIRSGVVL